MEEPKKINPDPAFNRMKACRHGTVIFNRNDCYVGRSFELYGEFKELEVELFRQIVKEGQVVLDVGANIGQHTLFFSHAVGEQGRVYAFEPQRLFFQTLCGNMALNHIVNVFCVHAAVGAQAGKLNVPAANPRLAEFNFAALALKDYSWGEMTEMTTVDSLQLDQCDFMKIEVVGMEEEVLAGARNTIERHRPVLYVENDEKGYEGELPQGVQSVDNEKASSRLVRRIADLGYELYWHRPPYFNPNNYFKNQENIFGEACSQNMLCLPEGHGHDLVGFERIAVPH